MTSQEKMKQAAGEYAVSLIKPGMTIGIGTGSTVFYFIKALAQKVADGFDVSGVPTSKKTEALAIQSGIPLVDLNEVDVLDLAIDGADETDPQLQLIKGGGGSLLQEKIVATAATKLVIIADAEKAVNILGRFPLPVEVIPFGWKQTAKHISKFGCNSIVLRQREGKTFVSDHGHYILDCHFEKIENAALLTRQLNGVAGVVENGLFLNIASMAILGQPDGSVKIIEK
jgi:ribose 5-phosphate isomerase A